ncbi:MAG: hypothetical protein IH984_13735 [Planctomycetes bacterium]|nr:hypothetical protein [Planctomycetota bacterium]
MRFFSHSFCRSFFAIAIVASAAPIALAGSHSWDIVEIFSNADGSIQFIEMMETNAMPNEINLAGKQVTSNANAFTFPSNLIPPTTNKHLLLATADFAALPGAPTPDYIIKAGFFNPNGDTLMYHTYDIFSFGHDVLPTDCINSLNGDGTTGVNNPENYQDVKGTVDACPPCPWDLDGTGSVGTGDLLELFAQWGTAGPADFDESGAVGTNDLLILFANWGPCK